MITHLVAFCPYLFTNCNAWSWLNNKFEKPHGYEVRTNNLNLPFCFDHDGEKQKSMFVNIK